MKTFTQSEKINLNYATCIVKIDNVKTHPNPEVTRLDIVNIRGNDIIVGRGSIKVGDIVVYCPSESSLNMEFLRENDQFRDFMMNKSQDKKKCGFFENKGRVKAINLKGVISTGFIFPLEWLTNWQPELNLKNIENYIDQPFDTVNGQLFSKKYVIRQLRQSGSGMGNNKLKRNNKLQRFDKLIENQFSFHYDTHRLADKVFTIEPDDVISITSKYHGTSCITAYVSTNKELKWYEKWLKKLGVDINTTQYDYIYSSRGVVKNRYINKGVGSGFYGNTDIWTIAGEQLKPLLTKGLSIYSEIVGYLPGSNTFIQKNHDYKCHVGEYAIYIYRITYTNIDGDVYEFSAKQVQRWCKNNITNDPVLNIRTSDGGSVPIVLHQLIYPVKELYYGKAKDVYPELSTEEHWHKNFVEMLSNDKTRFYMEVNSPDCNNDVPHEGIVVRNESTGGNALKLKTKAHFLMETVELDSGEADIESIEECNDGEEES
jgi:hypothetical protein